MDYIVFDGENQRGPYSLHQLKTMWEHGVLTTRAMVWREEPKCWVPLHSLVEKDVKTETRTAPTLPLFPIGSWYNAATFSGRWTRRKFIGLVVLYTAVFLLGIELLNPSHDDLIGQILVCVLLSLYAYLMLCAAVKRMHDMNWSAWGVLFLPLGLTWFILAIAGGTDGDNRYGENPRTSD